MKETYKFYIDTFSNDLKQHINLSESAWLTINEDIQNFYSSPEKETFAGFLNQIFKNFYQTSNATISLRALEKKTELGNIYSSLKSEALDKKSINKFIDEYIKIYEENLIKINTSLPNSQGKKFRINKENIEILRDSFDAQYYNGSIGLYLKAIFEDYCKKPSYIREQIFFNDCINKINLAISKQNKIKIILTEQLATKDDKKISKKFYVLPYKIVQDKTQLFNYLIGISEEIKEINEVDDLGNKIRKNITLPPKITCFRISRIQKTAIMTSMGAHITKETICQIEKTLIEKTPQFLSGELIDIKIEFTDKGLELFKRQLYMRPQFYEISKESKYIYTFHCTELQAINYFFKFAMDAHVISPIYLKNKFSKKYENAYKTYLEK